MRVQEWLSLIRRTGGTKNWSKAADTKIKMACLIHKAGK